MIVSSRVMWCSDKNDIKFWVAFAITIINVTIMIIMVSDNTDGCS